MVPMRMRDNDHVETGKIDMHGLDVLAEHLNVVACIKQDALALKLNERGIPPVLLKADSIAKSVVEYRHPILGQNWKSTCQSENAKPRP